MSEYKKRRRTPPTFKQGIVAAIIGSFIIGAAAGVILANNTDISQYNTLSQYLDIFLQGHKSGAYNKYDIFKTSLFKYGKYAAAIWLLGFIPAGSIAALFLMGFKGLGVGFATAVLINNYGFTGAVYGVLLYLPQNAVLIPAYFLIVYSNINFILHNIESDDKSPSAFMGYLVILAICAALVVLASIIEAYM